MFQQITLCPIHKQFIIMYEGKIEEPNINALCGVCLQEKFRDHELLLPEQIHQKYQHKLDQSMNLNKNIINNLQELLNGIIDFKRKITNDLEAFSQLISDYSLLINNEKTILTQQQENDSNIKFNEFQWLNNYVKSKLQEKLVQIQKNTDFKYFQSVFNLLNGTSLHKTEQKIKCKKLSNLNINYNCSSVAFNAINRILFIGNYYGFIRVYGFYNNKKLIQNLSIHYQSVVCLIFLKKSNLLVSGSDDKSIIIWKQGLNNQWEPHQTLLSHLDSISSILMNKVEDLMISGSAKQIKFWLKSDLNWRCSYTIETDFCYCLSLNSQQKKLISCEYKKIKVFELQSNYEWLATQIIKIQESGYQISFINDHQFVFQPEIKGFLEIYNFEDGKKQFILADLIKVQNIRNCDYLPIQILEQKNIFMVKHGSWLNFFGKHQNQDYELCRKFQFGSHSLHGGLSNDGSFLIAGETQKLYILLLKYLD